jgi:uncharacterized protein (TIGR02391 family)
MTGKKQKKRKYKKKEPVMRITKARREQIEQLAEAIAIIAPATTPGKGFCVQRVAEQHGIKKYWRSGINKRQMIARFLEDVFRQFPRKPKVVVIDIVRGGLEWRSRKGERTTIEELNNIASPMAALGIDILKALKKLKIPDPSRVCAPTQDRVSLIERLELNEALTDDCLEMFRDGHFNEAIRKGLERFETYIQATINDNNSIGKHLMAKAFKHDHPLIPINENKTGTEQSEQEGFMYLTMGAMAGMRNLYSHGDAKQMTAQDAIERLAFVSLLFKRVNKALVAREIGK